MHDEDWQSTHVLCCLEHPAAKPVYYIFEDYNERLMPERSYFKEAYLRDERRKFERMAYVKSDNAALWVQPALNLLEERLSSPAAVVEQRCTAVGKSAGWRSCSHWLWEVIRWYRTLAEYCTPSWPWRFSSSPSCFSRFNRAVQ
ncbi:hypothetical protein CYMTET_23334 [Cymbomonas tetramitiformis]|uniref:Uncharacterized protein n=1 Tax=Cymbomonas tetramitiformis TaxID=36881 RepID=A0AAE0FYM5_9CHLO|nr:hypothetical protein CYMTET_23334 [Cymbomonas tetramitiformis]